MVSMGEAKRFGRALEAIVTGIERIVGSQGGYTVRSRVKVPHLITGTLREFDVVLRFEHQHHILTTAIECKDLKRKVSVKDIEAYKTKLDGTPINRGCVVSSSGYTKEALRLADAYKIECIRISDVEDVDWLNADSMTQWDISVKHYEYVVMFDIAEGPPPAPYAFSLYTQSGELIDEYQLVESALLRLPPDREWTEGEAVQEYRDDVPLIYALDSDGKRRTVLVLGQRLHYHATMLSGPLRYHRYETGKSILSVATAYLQGASGRRTAVHVKEWQSR